MSEAGQKKGCKKRRRERQLGSKRQRANKKRGSAGGKDPFGAYDDIHINIARGIQRVPNGRLIDKMLKNEGRSWDVNTGLFLKPKGVKNAAEEVSTGLLMSEINGDPE